MKEELLKRTKYFAISVWQLTQQLPIEFKDFRSQLIRSSSSVGANYRAAVRAKSTKDFINKLKIVEEELDESLYFIELIGELNKQQKDKWRDIYSEGDELLSIFVKSIVTLRKKNDVSRTS